MRDKIIELLNSLTKSYWYEEDGTQRYLVELYDKEIEDFVDNIIKVMNDRKPISPKVGLSELLSAQTSFDDIYSHVMEFREKYLRAWVAENGLRPSECELVEQRLPNKIILNVRKRITR